jgi:uncharacterized protein
MINNSQADRSPPGSLERVNSNPSAEPLHTSTPANPRERLPELDTLRGFALLGILAVNIETFAGPEALHDVPIGVAKAAFVGWHASLDIAILAFKWIFVEGKMRALFAMLYGAGCIILTDRIERRSGIKEARYIFYRRNALLLLFGIIHGTLIWFGDILTQYAACGLLVPYLIRRLKGRSLVIFGVIILLFAGFVTNIRACDALNAAAKPGESNSRLAIARMLTPTTPVQARAEKIEDQNAIRKLNMDASKEALRVRSLDPTAKLREQYEAYFSFSTAVVETGLIAEVIGAIVLGMGLYKTGYLTGSYAPNVYLRVASIGYAVAIPTVLIGIWQSAMHGFSILSTSFWMYLPYTLQQFSGAIANISLLLYCSGKGLMKSPLRRLADVGRMAFSNYILTSVICQGLFIWSPFNLFGRLEYYQGMLVVIAIWVIILVISPIWLRTFAFGPLEWIWRSLTYAKVQQWRLRSTAMGERA